MLPVGESEIISRSWWRAQESGFGQELPASHIYQLLSWNKYIMSFITIYIPNLSCHIWHAVLHEKENASVQHKDIKWIPFQVQRQRHIIVPLNYCSELIQHVIESSIPLNISKKLLEFQEERSRYSYTKHTLSW